MLSSKVTNLFCCFLMVLLLFAFASTVSDAAVVVNYDFASGLQGWTVRTDPAGGPNPQWLSWAPPNNYGVASCDHSGWAGSSYVESPLIAVTNGKGYTLTYDYANWGQGDSINVHLYNTAGQWLGAAVTAYDEIAWGWCPSLLITSTSQWAWATNRPRTFTATWPGQTVGYVSLQIIHWGTWGQSCFDNVKISTANYLATQYWTWHTAGAGAPHWSNYTYYGEPLLGYYSSHDPLVAANHIMHMLNNGVNALSYGFINQAGDATVWSGIDPDQAFMNGAMQAFNFDSIKFYITYDCATRAWLMHETENGNEWYPPRDLLPGVLFYDAGIDNPPDYWPTFNFNLQNSGKYIYDELLAFDFDYMARTYFNQPNYLKINGQCVVFIYDCWRFDNGGVGGITDGFARAFKRIRESLYNLYGVKVYLIGDMPRWSMYNMRKTWRTQGFYRQFDAIGTMNYADGPYIDTYLPPTYDLSNYTSASQTGQTGFRTEVFNTSGGNTRAYRAALAEPAKSAYGPSNVRIDFVPLLSFSFRNSDGSKGFWASNDSEVLGQANMVKALRDTAGATLAEESTATMSYHAAFNQWGEGQIIEPTIAGSPYYPGFYEWMYLGTIKGILGPGW